MTFTVSFNLNDTDINYFRDAIKEAQIKKDQLPENIILANARKLSSKIKGKVPTFVESRLQKLRILVEMLEDPDWQLPEQERQDILTALSYFNRANDLIKDDFPALGFIDDAIMIELVAESLSYSISMYHQFCIYREAELSRSKQKRITQKDWLANKHYEKLQRVSQRNARDHSSLDTFHSIF